MKKIILFVFVFLLSVPQIASAQSFIVNNKQSDKYRGGGAVIPTKKKQDFFKYNQRKDNSKTYSYNKKTAGVYKSKKQIEKEKKRAEEERQKRLKEWREKINTRATERFEAKKKTYLEKLKREKEAKNRKKKNSSSMPKNYKKTSSYIKVKSNKKKKNRYTSGYYNQKPSNSGGGYSIMKIEKKPQYSTRNRPGLRLRY